MASEAGGFANTDRQAVTLFVSLMRDLLPRVRAEELLNSYLVPAEFLMQRMGELRDVRERDRESLPYTFWERIGKDQPDAVRVHSW